MTRTPWITATPNPAPGGSGLGITTISWDAGTDEADVWVSQNGAMESTFAGDGRGRQVADWIQWPFAYHFRLRARDTGAVLAEVRVSRDPLLPEIAARTVVATVTEAHDPYARDTELLFRSLRAFGGEMARSRAIAYVVDQVDDAFRERLEGLQVEVRVVPRVEGTHRTANKLRMFEEAPDADWLVALDNDLVVARDFSAQVFGEALGVCLIDDFRYDRDDWRHYQRLLGVEPQRQRSIAVRPVGGEPEIPMAFHGGVQIVPRDLVATFGKAWRDGIARAPRDVSEPPEGGWSEHMARLIQQSDQPSLTRGVFAAGIPWRMLPLAMNVPTHTEIHPALDPDHVVPYLIHHHHRRDAEGRVLPGSHARLNEEIYRINRVLFPATGAGE